MKKDRAGLLPEEADDIKDEFPLFPAHRRKLTKPADALADAQLAHVAHAADLQAVQHPLDIFLHPVAFFTEPLRTDQIIAADAPAKRIMLAEPAFLRFDDDGGLAMCEQTANDASFRQISDDPRRNVRDFILLIECLPKSRAVKIEHFADMWMQGLFTYGRIHGQIAAL